MLSDYDSKVIKSFGILNTTIDPDNDVIHRTTNRGFYGLPFPGVYVTDSEGRVTEKFFHRNFATRASAGTIRNSAIGRILSTHETPTAELSNEHVKVSAFLADESLRFESESTVYVRFEVANGYHMYAAPLPEGFIASTATIAATKGVRVGEPKYPQTTPREFPALGVTLNVYEGVTDVAIPVIVGSEILDWSLRDKPTEIELPIEVVFQACSEKVCFRPQRKQLVLKAPIGSHVMPERRRRAKKGRSP